MDFRHRLRPFIFALLPITAASQEPVDSAVVRSIRAEAFDRSQVMEHAFFLTDVYGPRLTGSPGFRRAGEWSLARLRTFGLANVHAESFPWKRGWEARRFSVELVAPQYLPAIAVPIPWSLSTLGMIEGEAIIAALPTSPLEYDAFFKQHKGKLRGKIILATLPVEREGERGARISRSDSALAVALARELSRSPPQARDTVEADWARSIGAELTRENRLNRFLKEQGAAALLYQGRTGDGTIETGYVASLKRAQPAMLGYADAELPRHPQFW